ncbi:hypothetical protein DV736_g1894, partial [Chaetothyriales sp. CBS 134916]
MRGLAQHPGGVAVALALAVPLPDALAFDREPFALGAHVEPARLQARVVAAGAAQTGFEAAALAQRAGHVEEARVQEE